MIAEYLEECDKYLSENEIEYDLIDQKYHRINIDQPDNETSKDTRNVKKCLYYLSELKDNKKMQEFLLNWKVFDIMFNSSFSYSLLKYWNECGGYGLMVKLYLGNLKKMSNNKDDEEEQIKLCIRNYNVSLLLCHAGKMNKSLELMERALEILKSLDCTDKSKKLLKIYGQLGHICMNMVTCTDDNYYEVVCKVIEYHNMAIELILTEDWENDNELKSFMVLQLMKKAFAIGDIHFWNDYDRAGYNIPSSIDEAKEYIKQAKELCIKKDNMYVDIILAEATLYYKDPAKQHSLYSEAIQQCKELFSDINPAMTRLCYNNALVYENEGNYKEAYKYCLKAYNIACNIYGHDHKYTKKYNVMLSELSDLNNIKHN